MRGVIVDWIVGVHLQFRLLPETLYTTVAIFDRYIEQGGGVILYPVFIENKHFHASKNKTNI